MSVSRYIADLRAGAAQVEIEATAEAERLGDNNAFDAFVGRTERDRGEPSRAFLIVDGREVEDLEITTAQIRELVAAGATVRPRRR
jgi:hypothetical protein